jgi:hypothetical protein
MTLHYPDSESALQTLRSGIQVYSDFRLQPVQLGVARLGLDWSYPDLCAPYWRLYHNPDAGAWVQPQGQKRIRLRPEHVYLIPAWLHFSVGGGNGQRHHFLHFDMHGIPPELQRQLFGSVWAGPVGSAADALGHLCENLILDAQEDLQLCHRVGVPAPATWRLQALLLDVWQGLWSDLDAESKKRYEHSRSPCMNSARGSTSISTAT